MSRLRMFFKFEAIYAEASQPENILPFAPDRDRFVCFSDHHKGDGGNADDFRKNASLYSQALSYYEEQGYRLILLGDNEELWETRMGKVLELSCIDAAYKIRRCIETAVEIHGTE